MAKHAVLLYDTNPATRRPLAESFEKVFPNVLHRNVTGLPFFDICEAVRRLDESGYTTTILVSEAALPARLTSEWVAQSASYGLLRKTFGDRLKVVTTVSEMKQFMKEAVEGKIKEPTEVDRLKVQQKREEIALKNREGEEMLHAKERELEKKEREDTAKIESGDKKQDRGD